MHLTLDEELFGGDIKEAFCYTFETIDSEFLSECEVMM